MTSIPGTNSSALLGWLLEAWGTQQPTINEIEMLELCWLKIEKEVK